MSWFKTVLWSVLSAAPEVVEHHWLILTVRDTNGHEVATRRFESDKAAEMAREEFVTRVNSLSDSDFEAADWQRVLDLS
jgi:hypothetical protein